MNTLFGGIEGGGTKFVCAVGTGPDDIRRETRFPTTTLEETLGQAVAFFKEAERDFGRLSALGVATFGPIDPNPASPAYGFVLPTPKPGWSNTNVLGMLKSAFDMPIAFELDVNGAALGEWTWGAAQGLDTFIYLTVGTGVGGREDLLPLIRRETQAILNGYVQSPAITQNIDGFIVPPGLGSRAGMLGAIALAKSSL